MFYGEYEQAVDIRGRVSLPATLRGRLGDHLVVTRGLDGCLVVYAIADWEKLASAVGQLPLTRSVARAVTRLLLGGASEQTLDVQGHLTLPDSLKRWARLDNMAVVVGAGDHIEIWSDTAWNEVTTQLAQDNAAMAETLSQLGFALS